mmetsp:Transcript_1455/g.4971  ORF Transcript_1455/g.4971 Transcript_1455/m.4971 type:complete len:232 (+) Transcript_1455:1055-1750(+)
MGHLRGVLVLRDLLRGRGLFLRLLRQRRPADRLRAGPRFDRRGVHVGVPLRRGADLRRPSHPDAGADPRTHLRRHAHRREPADHRRPPLVESSPRRAGTAPGRPLRLDDPRRRRRPRRLPHLLPGARTHLHLARLRRGLRPRRPGLLLRHPTHTDARRRRRRRSIPPRRRQRPTRTYGPPPRQLPPLAGNDRRQRTRQKKKCQRLITRPIAPTPPEPPPSCDGVPVQRECL